MTDSIVLILITYFLISGWCKGLLRTLLGPISLLIGGLFAVIYYTYTSNMIVAFTIAIIGPIILNILFSFTLNIWQHTVNANKPLAIESRLLGSGLSFLWGSVHTLIILILIIIVPIELPWLKKAREDIFISKTYSLANGLIKHLKLKQPVNLQKIPQTLQDPEQQERLQSSNEYKTVMDDETLQEILKDEDIIEAAKNKDFSKLITNPRIQEIFQNKELLKKMLDLNFKIMQQSTFNSTTEDSDSTQ